MVVFTPDQQASIRKYLGYSPLYRDMDPALENAMRAISAVSDGGQMPDDSTVVQIIAILDQLAGIETKISSLYCGLEDIEFQSGTTKTKTNNLMAISFLRNEGWRTIQKLSIPMSTKPQRNYFGAPTLQPSFGGFRYGGIF